jgi:hypothetical protein
MSEAEVWIKIAGLVLGLIRMRIKSASTEFRTKDTTLNIDMYNANYHYATIHCKGIHNYILYSYKFQLSNKRKKN